MKYRPEIDGLRAVAVLPVLLFHAGFGAFGGGFVGVDVFFVISGYLITAILIAELEEGRFSILGFYERRARRILPALFLVMACCLPFAWFWMLPNELYSFARSLVAVSLFLSNILFWRERGYFAAAAEETPLLHTWSLAVEEQFYLLFPIFLLLVWRFGRTRVFWMIAGFAAISLGVSEWGWRHNPSANFYLAPTRAWELFAGSIAAFLLRGRELRGNDLLAGLGLAAIGLSIFAYDRHTPFPSLYALLPVGGSFLIILFAARDTAVGRLLGARWPVAVGLISFSTYLWHQPLMAFVRIRSDQEPGPAVMLGLCLLSLLLAWGSWRFVERPFRLGGGGGGGGGILRRRGVIFGASGLGLVAFSAIGAMVVSANGYDNRLTAQQKQVLSWLSYPRQQYYREGECFLEIQFDETHFDPGCGGDEKTLIWGDSYAAALASGWLLMDPGIGQYTASACPPLLGVDFPPRPHCRGINDFVFDRITALDDPHVVLQSYWWGHSKYMASLNDTITALQGAGVTRITIVGGTPTFAPTLPNRLLSAGIGVDGPHRLRADTGFIIAADRKLRAIADRHGVRFVSAIAGICDAQGHCDAVIEAPSGGYEPIAWDRGHLTRAGALHILRRMPLEE